MKKVFCVAAAVVLTLAAGRAGRLARMERGKGERAGPAFPAIADCVIIWIRGAWTRQTCALSPHGI